MTAEARSVVVIGRGMIGLSTAFALAEDGWKVTVAGPKEARGSATRAAVGTSTLKGNIIAGQPFFALKIAAHKGLQAWLAHVAKAAERSIAQSFSGAFEPFSNVAEYRFVRERVFHRRFAGCFDATVWPKERLSQHFTSSGCFPSTALGAYHYFRDGWYDPVACLEALEAALRMRGVPFLEDPVRAVLPHPDAGLNVDFAGRLLQTPECVLAAGVFSDEILANSGIAHMRQELFEGETVVASVKDATPVVLKVGRMNFVVHEGQLRVGSTSRRAPDLFSCRSSAEQGAMLASLSASQFGGVAPTTLWGVRGRFKDHFPGIGALLLPGGTRRLWASLGFYKNGLQLGPLFARNLVSTMTSSATISTAFPLPLAAIKT